LSGHCTPVPPTSRRDIRLLAEKVRSSLHLQTGWFPIVDYMEIYQLIEKDFVYDIVDTSEMSEHGLTFPDQKLMFIREDVYERARDGCGRDRLTIAHEFGHLLMHRNLGLARTHVVRAETVPPHSSSEWQANCFGGELLIPASRIGEVNSPEAAANHFGVSLQAAKYQWRIYQTEGIIK